MAVVRLGDVAMISQGLSTSGRGAGARPGSWQLGLISGKDIEDDRVRVQAIEFINVDQNLRTEKHLLRPYDVLVTAKSTKVKVALVPPSASRMVANSTLLVVRSDNPDLGSYLWWFLSSRHGRARLESMMVPSATLWSLSAGTLAELEVPMPELPRLFLIAQLVEASEQAYAAATEAAAIRRDSIRDHIISHLLASEHLNGGLP
jgi:hypothetical protein